MTQLMLISCFGMLLTTGQSRAADEQNYLGKSFDEWVKMLESKNEDDRLTASAAMVVLAKRGEKAKPAVPVLSRGLSDKNDDIRRRCAEALMVLGKHSKDALPALEKALQRLRRPRPETRGRRDR